VAADRKVGRGIDPTRSVHAHRANPSPSKLDRCLQTYAGALVAARRSHGNRGPRPGRVQKFGHTAELVRTAHVESTQQKTVVLVVRNLAIFNGAIIVLLVVYAHAVICRLVRLSPWFRHRNSGVDPSRAAGYVYARGGAGCKSPGTFGCASDTLVRCRRSGHSRRSLLG